MAKRLRSGYTTGACAAAAAKGATQALLSGQALATVEIPLPDASRVEFALCRCVVAEQWALASVVKDAGDDLDVTNGAEIVATARRLDNHRITGNCVPVKNDKRLIICGGQGVGTVTKPGLAVPVGEPAINPVPRRMIQEAVTEALDQENVTDRFEIVISVPAGEELAKKTLNQRLGIVSGLSILGTTGIVHPVSAAAWTATIEASMAVARAAGILAAKHCSDLIVFCHPIPLDWIEVRLEEHDQGIRVSAEVRSVWKTGVEVEAITAVTGALLNAYDMLKPLDQNLSFGEIRVVKKKGGKSDFSDRFPTPVKTAILVMSDSTHAGKREDKSGKVIAAFLTNQPVAVDCYEILPDDREAIIARLKKLADEEGFQLVFTTGGTGLGPRDVTPEATIAVLDRTVPGIALAIRQHGKERTPYAMLSRGEAGLRGECLIINLPGSSKGALESMQALFPGLLHIFPMMQGKGH